MLLLVTGVKAHVKEALANTIYGNKKPVYETERGGKHFFGNRLIVYCNNEDDESNPLAHLIIQDGHNSKTFNLKLKLERAGLDVKCIEYERLRTHDVYVKAKETGTLPPMCTRDEEERELFNTISKVYIKALA